MLPFPFASSSTIQLQPPSHPEALSAPEPFPSLLPFHSFNFLLHRPSTRPVVGPVFRPGCSQRVCILPRSPLTASPYDEAGGPSVSVVIAPDSERRAPSALQRNMSAASDSDSVAADILLMCVPMSSFFYTRRLPVVSLGLFRLEGGAYS